jgi:hypothetical protein
LFCLSTSEILRRTDQSFPSLQAKVASTTAGCIAGHKNHFIRVKTLSKCKVRDGFCASVCDKFRSSSFEESVFLITFFEVENVSVEGLFQCQGSFWALGIVGQDPSDSTSNWLHVDIIFRVLLH